jgi:peptide/nickel transport system permease protein
MVLTLFVLTLAIFYATTFFSPAQRAAMFVSPTTINPEEIDLSNLAERLHLTDPFYVQYLDWLRLSLVTGKLGYTLNFRGFVLDVIWQRLPPTIELVMFSAPIVIFGGIKLGTYSAKRAYHKTGREDVIDSSIRAFTTLAYSMPLFFTGLLSITIFFLNLHWFAPSRIGSAAENFILLSGSWNSYTGLYTIDSLLNGQVWIFLDALRHLVLPVAILTISMLPVVVRITRSSMLAEYSQSYVIVARAKGLKEGEVISRVKKNALISILTVTSILLANLMTGIVVIEYIFSWGGIGSLAVDAAAWYDFPLLAGLSVVFCLVFVTINLLVDIIYTYIDPRVKL